MKVKMLVAVVASSLLAVSLAHAVPSQKSPTQLVADDVPAAQDNSATGSTSTNPGAMNDSSTMQNSGSPAPNGSVDNSAANGSTDDSSTADAPAGSDDSDY